MRLWSRDIRWIWMLKFNSLLPLCQSFIYFFCVLIIIYFDLKNWLWLLFIERNIQPLRCSDSKLLTWSDFINSFSLLFFLLFHQEIQEDKKKAEQEGIAVTTTRKARPHEPESERRKTEKENFSVTVDLAKPAGVKTDGRMIS